MRFFRKHLRIIISVGVVVVGIVFLYFLPVGQSLFGIKSSPTPTPDYSGWRSYTNQKYGISLKYPSGFQLVPGKTGPLAEWQLYGVIDGIEIVSIEIPRSSQIRTNFLGASLRVGLSTDTTAIKECLSPPKSLDYKNTYTKRVIGGVTFQEFVRSEAGAGNFYEYVSYRAVRDGGCEVFEYSIHKTNIDNYPVEAGRKEFDRIAIVNALESILDTVQFLK